MSTLYAQQIGSMKCNNIKWEALWMLSSGPMRNSEFSLASPRNGNNELYRVRHFLYATTRVNFFMKAKVNKYMLNPILHNWGVFFLAKSEGWYVVAFIFRWWKSRNFLSLMTLSVVFRNFCSQTSMGRCKESDNHP
jgi:hypothetical protein